MLITTLIGSVITIGTVSMKAEDIVHSAQSATNSANLHQIATVLEIYYSDHQSYPSAHNGQELIDELEKGEYIRTRPVDPSIFNYAPEDNGQDYSLAIKQ